MMLEREVFTNVLDFTESIRAPLTSPEGDPKIFCCSFEQALDMQDNQSWSATPFHSAPVVVCIWHLELSFPSLSQLQKQVFKLRETCTRLLWKKVPVLLVGGA